MPAEDISDTEGPQAAHYLRVCQQYDVTPCSIIRRGLDGTRLDLRYQGICNIGTLALASTLYVRVFTILTHYHKYV